MYMPKTSLSAMRCGHDRSGVGHVNGIMNYRHAEAVKGKAKTENNMNWHEEFEFSNYV